MAKIIPENYFSSMLKDSKIFSKLKLYKNISYLFDEVCKDVPNKFSIIWKDGKKTFNELYNDVSKARTYLINNNVKYKDHVGLIFKNEYDFVVFFFATLTLGCVAACIPESLPVPALHAISNKFDCRVVIVSNYCNDKLIELKKLDNNKYLSCNEFVLLKSCDINFDINENDPACIVFTGGTTGNPKGALLSHRNLCRGAINGCYTPEKKYEVNYFSLIPFTHIFGLVKNLLSCFLSRSCLYVIANPLNFVSELPIANPDVLVLTPGLAKIVLTVIKKFGKNVLGKNMTTIIAGGANVPATLINEFYQFGIHCFPGYGSTESTNLVSGNVSIPKNLNSVGIPYPDQKVSILDGEIVIQGDNVFLGYYKDKAKTDEVLKNGILHTGDLGYFDEDGFLYITGRKNNLIVLPSGLKISPEEIEEEINKCIYVSDSVVYKENINETINICAEVFLEKELKINNAKGLVEDYILNEVNKKVERFAKINKVIFREVDFKRSPAMKIIREH